MDARARLEKLVNLSAYAASKDLIVIPIHRRASEGELISVGIGNFPDRAGEDADTVRRTITFKYTAPNSATYREEFLDSDGGRKAISDTLPYDFSDSYRMADFWRASGSGKALPWQEFGDAKALIDFLAGRLNAPL